MAKQKFDEIQCARLVIQNGKSVAIELRADKNGGAEANFIGKDSEGNTVNFLALNVAPNGSWQLRANKQLDPNTVELTPVAESVFFPGGDTEPITDGQKQDNLEQSKQQDSST